MKNLPTMRDLQEALSKPNNGLLICELSNVAAKQLHDWIKTLTMGELLNAPENVPAALYKIMKELEDDHRIPEKQIDSNVLCTVDVGEERFELAEYRQTSRSSDDQSWHYGLVVYRSGDDEAIDVDELDEATAICILAALFNIHITDDKGICHH